MRTDLPTNRLGTTDMAITRVGFGAWAIGGAGWKYAWGGQDDDESIVAIRHAVERGINWIDTAAVYGLGHSEEVVAKAIGALPEPDRPYVFTKGGMVWDDAHRSEEPPRIASPESLRREVEASLRRLQVERIDLYQLHWPPDDGTPVEVYWQTFDELRREGKIRAAGLSNHGVDLLERANAVAHVDSLQPPFSAVRRDAADDVIPWCSAHETGVIVYSPMESGLLTGSFSEARAAALGPDDWRSRSDRFQGDQLRANLSLVDAMRPIADRHGTSVAAVAVAWTLAFPGVTGAIVGARSPGQVDGWLDAATLTLDSVDLAELAVAVHTTGAGSGPTSP